MKWLIVLAFIGLIGWCYYDLHRSGAVLHAPVIKFGGSL